jgi:hypothetical protein
MDENKYTKLLKLVYNLAGILATGLIIYIIYITAIRLGELNLYIIQTAATDPAATAIYILTLSLILIYVLGKTATMLFKYGAN